MGTVTAKQLKNRTGEVLRRVRSGETVTITVRGAGVAQVAPLTSRARARRAREARAPVKALVRSIGGKYRGLATAREFLAKRAEEIARER